LNAWDCAAGYLIVRESDGVVTNFVGRRGSIYEGAVVASNGLIHEEMLAVLKSVNQKE
jgi:myo-inositol-1(or 4)-monophosphatase